MLSRQFASADRVLMLVMLLGVLAGAPAASAPIIYVDAARPNDSGNGLSWATAKKTPQAAVDAAALAGGGEVWVRQGTYGRTISSPDGSLVLKSNVRLYGGFQGNETTLTQRNAEARPTILDGSAQTGAAGPAAHVVSLTSTTNCRLDGFQITGGNKGNENPGVDGGGILCLGADASNTIANCRIYGNQAMFGGGILCKSQTAIVIEGCSIHDNQSFIEGGGLCCWQSSPTIRNCTIQSNQAGSGGALTCINSCSPRLSSCIIKNNTATNRGGGARIYFGSSPEFTNCKVTSNTAGNGGGGIHAERENNLKLVNCVLSRNTAAFGGGLLLNEKSQAIVTNCTIAQNNIMDPDGKGGGLRCNFGSGARITNTIFSQNQYYAVYVVDLLSSATMVNCLLHGNSMGDVAADGHILTWAPATNINYPPIISDMVVGDPNLRDDYVLCTGSMAIDRGTAVGAAAYDIDHVARPLDVAYQGNGGLANAYDIGAYEFTPATLTPSARSLNFTEARGLAVDVEHQGAPTTMSLTLSNEGPGRVSFVGGDPATPGFALSGPYAGDYRIKSIEPWPGQPLAAGATMTVVVEFAPGQSRRAMGLAATLRVTSNAINEPELEIQLQGDATPVTLSGLKVD